MHHHHTPKPNYSLETLRAAIDSQDDAILAALTARQRLVDRIRAIKTAEGHLVYRPGREAKILRRLFAAADPALDRNLINQMWREIFSSAVLLQEPLKIAVVEENNFSLRELARQAFGHGAILQSGNLSEAMAKLKSGQVSLAVVPMSPDALRQILSVIETDETIHITNILPFLSGDMAPQAYAIGRVCPEESGDDITLFREDDEIKMMDGFHLDVPGWLGVVPRPWNG